MKREEAAVFGFKSFFKIGKNFPDNWKLLIRNIPLLVRISEVQKTYFETLLEIQLFETVVLNSYRIR